MVVVMCLWRVYDSVDLLGDVLGMQVHGVMGRCIFRGADLPLYVIFSSLSTVIIEIL